MNLLSSVVLCAVAMACGALPLEAIKKIEKKKKCKIHIDDKGVHQTRQLRDPNATI